MKKLFILPILLIILASCGSNESSKELLSSVNTGNISETKNINDISSSGTMILKSGTGKIVKNKVLDAINDSISKGEVSGCDKLAGSDKINCINGSALTLAGLNKSTSECDVINDKNQKQICINLAIRKIALDSLDVKICAELKNDSLIFSCEEDSMFNIALQTKNSKYCDKLRTGTFIKECNKILGSKKVNNN